MAINPHIQQLLPQITAWRRDIHQHPELDFDVHRTAGMVAKLLHDFGVDEVVEGIGKTGVVGLIHGRESASGKTIGLRADMDALPIVEETGVAYASSTSGKMHACGHDGHTAMLLGAAQVLAAERNFNGKVALIFQPAEEGGGGGKVMVEDGMMERFSIQQVFGMHNMPGMAIGEFGIRVGPQMACADQFDIIVEGRAGHAALPHQCIDTTLVASHIILALQGIASRMVDPMEPVVVSVTSVQSDSTAYNVIPKRVHLKGTLRALKESVREQAEALVSQIAESTANTFGAVASVVYEVGYPVTVNAADETGFAAAIAGDVSGEANVDANTPAIMGAEDFSFMLNARPGAFIFMGNGQSASLHHPKYDFNDDAIGYGSSYWVELARQAMPLQVN